MIKVTEIFKHPQKYDPSKEKIVSNFGFREIYINPQFVVMMREDEQLSQLAEKQDLMEDLHKEVRFTEIYLSGPGIYKGRISVVGTPEVVSHDFV